MGDSEGGITVRLRLLRDRETGELIEYGTDAADTLYVRTTLLDPGWTKSAYGPFNREQLIRAYSNCEEVPLEDETPAATYKAQTDPDIRLIARYTRRSQSNSQFKVMEYGVDPAGVVHIRRVSNDGSVAIYDGAEWQPLPDRVPEDVRSRAVANRWHGEWDVEHFPETDAPEATYKAEEDFEYWVTRDPRWPVWAKAMAGCTKVYYWYDKELGDGDDDLILVGKTSEGKYRGVYGDGTVLEDDATSETDDPLITNSVYPFTAFADAELGHNSWELIDLPSFPPEATYKAEEAGTDEDDDAEWGPVLNTSDPRQPMWEKAMEGCTEVWYWEDGHPIGDNMMALIGVNAQGQAQAVYGDGTVRVGEAGYSGDVAGDDEDYPDSAIEWAWRGVTDFRKVTLAHDEAPNPATYKAEATSDTDDDDEEWGPVLNTGDPREPMWLKAMEGCGIGYVWEYEGEPGTMPDNYIALVGERDGHVVGVCAGGKVLMDQETYSGDDSEISPDGCLDDALLGHGNWEPVVFPATGQGASATYKAQHPWKFAEGDRVRLNPSDHAVNIRWVRGAAGVVKEVRTDSTVPYDLRYRVVLDTFVSEEQRRLSGDNLVFGYFSAREDELIPESDKVPEAATYKADFHKVPIPEGSRVRVRVDAHSQVAWAEKAEGTVRKVVVSKTPGGREYAEYHVVLSDFVDMDQAYTYEKASRMGGRIVFYDGELERIDTDAPESATYKAEEETGLVDWPDLLEKMRGCRPVYRWTSPVRHTNYCVLAGKTPDGHARAVWADGTVLHDDEIRPLGTASARHWLARASDERFKADWAEIEVPGEEAAMSTYKAKAQGYEEELRRALQALEGIEHAPVTEVLMWEDFPAPYPFVIFTTSGTRFYWNMDSQTLYAYKGMWDGSDDRWTQVPFPGEEPPMATYKAKKQTRPDMDHPKDTRHAWTAMGQPPEGYTGWVRWPHKAPYAPVTYYAARWDGRAFYLYDTYKKACAKVSPEPHRLPLVALLQRKGEWLVTAQEDAPADKESDLGRAWTALRAETQEPIVQAYEWGAFDGAIYAYVFVGASGQQYSWHRYANFIYCLQDAWDLTGNWQPIPVPEDEGVPGATYKAGVDRVPNRWQEFLPMMAECRVVYRWYEDMVYDDYDILVGRPPDGDEVLVNAQGEYVELGHAAWTYPNGSINYREEMWVPVELPRDTQQATYKASYGEDDPEFDPYGANDELPSGSVYSYSRGQWPGPDPLYLEVRIDRYHAWFVEDPDMDVLLPQVLRVFATEDNLGAFMGWAETVPRSEFSGAQDLNFVEGVTVHREGFAAEGTAAATYKAEEDTHLGVPNRWQEFLPLMEGCTQVYYWDDTVHPGWTILVGRTSDGQERQVNSHGTVIERRSGRFEWMRPDGTLQTVGNWRRVPDSTPEATYKAERSNDRRKR